MSGGLGILYEESRWVLETEYVFLGCQTHHRGVGLDHEGMRNRKVKMRLVEVGDVRFTRGGRRRIGRKVCKRTDDRGRALCPPRQVQVECWGAISMLVRAGDNVGGEGRWSVNLGWLLGIHGVLKEGEG